MVNDRMRIPFTYLKKIIHIFIYNKNTLHRFPPLLPHTKIVDQFVKVKK